MRSLRVALVVIAVAGVLASTACVHVQEVRPLVSWGTETNAIVVVEDARVFPATGPEAIEHTDVVVEGGHIAAIGPHGTVSVPKNALVVDGRGKTLMPGLVDAHLHTQVTGAAPWYVVLPNPEHVLQEALYAGVTTAHDMGGPLDDVIALKKRVAAGDVIGPRLLVAGPLLQAPNGYPRSYISRVLPVLSPFFVSKFTHEIGSPDEGKRVVDELVEAGVDHIKITLADTPDGTPVFDAATIRAITDEAHAKGKRVFAHIDTAKNARLAADNGVDGLVHGVHSTPLSDDDAADIASHHVTVAPTLVTFERLYELSTSTTQLSPIEKESVAKNLQRSLRRPPKGYVLDAELASWLTHLSKYRSERLHDNVKKLHDRGVRILAGTDGHGSTAAFPGGIHEEMRRLVDAGIPNAEVLLGATSYAAHESLASPTFGTVEVGKDADLLLVDGNPLVDINATARIDTVIAHGRVVNRIPPH